MGASSGITEKNIDRSHPIFLEYRTVLVLVALGSPGKLIHYAHTIQRMNSQKH